MFFNIWIFFKTSWTLRVLLVLVLTSEFLLGHHACGFWKYCPSGTSESRQTYKIDDIKKDSRFFKTSEAEICSIRKCIQANIFKVESGAYLNFHFLLLFFSLRFRSANVGRGAQIRVFGRYIQTNYQKWNFSDMDSSVFPFWFSFSGLFRAIETFFIYSLYQRVPDIVIDPKKNYLIILLNFPIFSFYYAISIVYIS